MGHTKRTSAARRRRGLHKWVIAATLLLVIVVVSTVAYVCYPKDRTDSSSNEPQGLRTLTDHYLAVMHNLNSTETRAKMTAQQLDPNYNQTDLFSWEQGKLKFGNDPSGFYEDPIKILDNGKGICVQWSIVYVSACLALGDQSRLVVAVDSASWSFIHTWAEDYYNGTWVHVDPSDKVWNNPSRYQTWEWGSAMGSQVRIYAFEDGSYQDVTANYSAK